MTKKETVSDALIEAARVRGLASNRSPSQQIAYWASIGKLAEENPNLTFKTLEEDLELIEIIRQRENEPSKLVDINNL